MSGEAEYNECPGTLHASDIDRLSHAYIELQCFKVHNYVSITLSKCMLQCKNICMLTNVTNPCPLYCASLEDSEGSESTWEWCLACDLKAACPYMYKRIRLQHDTLWPLSEE